MKSCSRCGAANRDVARFCAQCGAPIAELASPTPPDPLKVRCACSVCGQHLSATPDMVGTLVNCPTCGTQLQVPAPQAGEA